MESFTYSFYECHPLEEDFLLLSGGGGVASVVYSFVFLDLCLFIYCFPAFIDLLISLGQRGLILFLLKAVSTFSKLRKLAGILVHSIKSLQSLV